MTYRDQVNQVINCIETLKETSKSSKKLAILSEMKDNTVMKELARRTYGEDKYFITLDQVIPAVVPSERGESENCDYTTILDQLRTRELSGNSAIQAVAEYISENCDWQLLAIALDHDFGCGVSKGTISKVWPDLFSKFGVALAEKYDEKTSKAVNFATQNWLASRKLDGVRCICTKINGEVHFYARSGKEFFTLSVLREAIENMKADNFVLDGECCIVDENGDEDFISIVSEIKRKNWTIENPCYQVFDCLTPEEFYSHDGDTCHSVRMLRDAAVEIKNGVDHTAFVEQHELRSADDFNYWIEQAAANGWEGIMIRKNIGYEGKRSKNMLKCKKFQDAEFTVLGCENDTMRFVEDGRQIEKTALARILIEYKGNTVSVGGGFSKAQRLWYADHHDELIGKTVTVKYFQESVNADGQYSLRFPTVKYIYEDGRDC